MAPLLLSSDTGLSYFSAIFMTGKKIHFQLDSLQYFLLTTPRIGHSLNVKGAHRFSHVEKKGLFLYQKEHKFLDNSHKHVHRKQTQHILRDIHDRLLFIKLHQ
jgi:hypothetical protein